MNLPQYSLDYKKVIYFFLAIFLIGGVTAFNSLGKKEDAPFVIKTAILMTQYPGATPEEVELLITEPIERAIQSLPNVYKIESQSFYGMSKISLELLPSLSSADIPQMWDALRRKVLDVQSKLPEGASTISVSDDFGDVYGIYYGLAGGDGYEYSDLLNVAQELQTQLVTVDGIKSIMLFGAQTEVINVFYSSARLLSMGIKPNMITDAIQGQNKMVSPGNRLAGEMQIVIEANGTYKSLDDIRNQLITLPSGNQVRLGDIAEIETGYVNPPSTIFRVNGKPAIAIGIATDPTRDVVKTGALVDEKISQIQYLIPEGMELVDLYPENIIAKQATDGFLMNLLESLLIVVVIIMLVMGFRAGVLIGSSLIFCIAGTLLIMQILGVGLNRTSLAGFIIAMGMLVDNAIVVTDNAQVAMKRGVDKRDALINGAKQPMWNLLGATLIAVISFLPLYLAPSNVAEIVKPLFVVLAISLSLSWVLALSQTVTFGSFILKTPKKEEKDPYDNKFYNSFGNFLAKLIKIRWVTLGIVIALFVGALAIMAVMPQDFFPNMDKPYFRANMFLPDGYNINDNQEMLEQMERDWLQKPAIKNISISLGNSPLRYYLASGSYGPNSGYSNVLIELHNSDSTAYYEAEFDYYMRTNFPDMVCRSALFQLSPVPDATIEIGFIGNNVDTLAKYTWMAESIMYNNPRTRDIRNSWGNKVPTWHPVYSQEKGQRLGISRQSVAQCIKVTTSGLPIGEYRQGDIFMPILLKDDRIESFNLSNLNTILCYGNDSTAVPLEQVITDDVYSYQYSVIRRLNRERIMSAYCDPERGENATQLFNELYDEIRQIPLPDEYKLKYEGQQEAQDESNAALMVYMPLMFILIFIILLLLFRTYREPIVIILMLPLIFIGVVIGLAVFGKSLDFFATLGLLGLIGMNIKNAVVLVDQIGIEVKKGGSPIAGVVAATKSRIVPVIMASGTTILGMVPLLFDSMFGGMAATIMGGLFIATMLTLIVLPVTYCTMHRYKN